MTSMLRDELVALTSDLIRFRSTADRPDQLAAVMDYVARYLESIPGLCIHRSVSNDKPAIVATLYETHTPALMLNGHLDVVMARPEQFEPEVRNGRIYGRASQDMKGSVAVLLRLLKDLAGREVRPDLGVQFVADEEIGGEHGTRRLLAEGWRCACFIALEPTDMGICHAHKGALWIDVQLPGVPAHGSLPWKGRNPILAFYAGLETLLRRFPPVENAAWCTTVTPTMIQTGAGAPNQIPSVLQFTLDVRHIPTDSSEMILDQVRSAFPTANYVKYRYATPLATSPDEPAIQRLAEVNRQVRGQATRFYSEHYSTDARFYGAAGIPAVCFGPVGAGLHSDEEWVEIASLTQLYEVLWRYIGDG